MRLTALPSPGSSAEPPGLPPPVCVWLCALFYFLVPTFSRGPSDGPALGTFLSLVLDVAFRWFANPQLTVHLYYGEFFTPARLLGNASRMVASACNLDPRSLLVLPAAPFEGQPFRVFSVLDPAKCFSR